MKLSAAAEAITTSPLLTLAAEINQKIQQGEKVYNLTIGDFNSSIFQIPEQLTTLIQQSYSENQTNYPGAFGLPELRDSVKKMLDTTCGIDVDVKDILVASGSRPLIYSLYKSVVDEGDKVIFPVPSWNNDYYTLMHRAEAVTVATSPENDFFPTVEDLKPHIQSAALLSLCSPQNPTGTLLGKEPLKAICDMVVAENQRRGADEKPLYVMFDQVYWMLTFGDYEFHHPLKVCPEIQPYAVFIDGISKSLAATGVRVGWATGPEHIIAKMRAFVAHIGAWAPRAEQHACGLFLNELESVQLFLSNFRAQLQQRLDGFYRGFMDFKSKGYDIDAIAPQAAIYLSVKINLKGKTTPEGKELQTDDDVHRYLLNDVGVGILPFSWFGADTHGEWYRISVGTCGQKEVDEILQVLADAFEQLS